MIDVCTCVACHSSYPGDRGASSGKGTIGSTLCKSIAPGRHQHITACLGVLLNGLLQGLGKGLSARTTLTGDNGNGSCQTLGLITTSYNSRQGDGQGASDTLFELAAH